MIKKIIFFSVIFGSSTICASSDDEGVKSLVSPDKKFSTLPKPVVAMPRFDTPSPTNSPSSQNGQSSPGLPSLRLVGSRKSRACLYMPGERIYSPDELEVSPDRIAPDAAALSTVPYLTLPESAQSEFAPKDGKLSPLLELNSDDNSLS